MALRVELQKRIIEARQRLSDAEQELSNLVDALEVNDRADKKMIGDALRAALDRVAAAKNDLDDMLR